MFVIRLVRSLFFSYTEKKEEIWLSPITKALKPTEFQKVKRQHKKRHQNFDYTTIADRLMTVSWINDNHPTGVVQPINGIPINAKAV